MIAIASILPCHTPTAARHPPLRALLLPLLAGIGALSASIPLTAQQLFVGDDGNNTVQEFNGAAGAYRGTIVASGGGGLDGPMGMIYTNGQLVVVNQNVNQPLNGEILQYDGKTGALVGKLVPASSANAPYAPRGLVRGGPDNNYYVADVGTQNGDCSNEGSVKQYNSAGAFLGNLDRSKFTGRFYPRGLVFGPDGLLYVSAMGCPYSPNPDEPNVGYVLRFNAATGTFVDQVASNQTVSDLHRPEGLVFDKDGNLWVTSFRSVSGGSDQILKLNGKTGTRIDSLVLWTGTAPRAYAQAILFGPGNKLYIPISGGDPTTAGQLRRCDVTTKTCAIIAPAGNPLQIPSYLIFKNSDPATLNFCGGE